MDLIMEIIVFGSISLIMYLFHFIGKYKNNKISTDEITNNEPIFHFNTMWLYYHDVVVSLLIEYFIKYYYNLNVKDILYKCTYEFRNNIIDKDRFGYNVEDYKLDTPIKSALVFLLNNNPEKLITSESLPNYFKMYIEYVGKGNFDYSYKEFVRYYLLNEYISNCELNVENIKKLFSSSIIDFATSNSSYDNNVRNIANYAIKIIENLAERVKIVHENKNIEKPHYLDLNYYLSIQNELSYMTGYYITTVRDKKYIANGYPAINDFEVNDFYNQFFNFSVKTYSFNEGYHLSKIYCDYNPKTNIGYYRCALALFYDRIKFERKNTNVISYYFSDSKIINYDDLIKIISYLIKQINIISTNKDFSKHFFMESINITQKCMLLLAVVLNLFINTNTKKYSKQIYQSVKDFRNLIETEFGQELYMNEIPTIKDMSLGTNFLTESMSYEILTWRDFEILWFENK